MKISEIRELPPAEIDNEIRKIRAQLFKYRMQATKEEVKKGGEIVQLRKRIARMKTVQRERVRAGAGADGPKPGKAGARDRS